MAQSPRYVEVQTPNGPRRIGIRYTRPFKQTVAVQFCFLFTAGIEHNCDEWQCWP